MEDNREKLREAGGLIAYLLEKVTGVAKRLRHVESTQEILLDASAALETRQDILFEAVAALVNNFEDLPHQAAENATAPARFATEKDASSE